MRRRLIGAMTLLSLLLGLAVAGLWGHSAVGQIFCAYNCAPDTAGVQRQWAVVSRNGRIFWRPALLEPGYSPALTGYNGHQSGKPVNLWPWLVGTTPDGMGIAGFVWEHRSWPGRDAGWWMLGAPDYFLLAVLLVLPLRWWLKRRPYPPNCCPKCGYDLRATPEASGALLNRCPECGRETGPCPVKAPGG